MLDKFKVIDAKVEIEEVSVKDYFSGKLPVVYFKTEEHGWVQRSANNLPPSDTSLATAQREASEALGRFITIRKHRIEVLSGDIVPHAHLTVNTKLLRRAADRDKIGQILAYAPPWQTIRFLGMKNDLHLEGWGSDKVDRFEVNYAETDEIKEKVIKIFDDYFQGLARRGNRNAASRL